MKYDELPLSLLLQERDVFKVFDEEFQKAQWLDVTALVKYDGTIRDLYTDGIVPSNTLDNIMTRLENMKK